MSNDRPLPYGWIKQFDTNHSRDFYVDTKATPPRSTWVHPYEDEQYLKEHPEVREKTRGSSGYNPPSDAPPRRASYHGESSSDRNGNGGSSNRGDKDKKGFFSKLKDKAIGTKEEREAARVAEQRLAEERRRRFRASNPAPSGYSQSQGYPQQYQGGHYQGPSQPVYAAAPQQQRRRGGGLGGVGLPILGGLAGGLFLGEALDGFGGDGGDGGFGGDGGGDFGGGDFGGGGDF